MIASASDDGPSSAPPPVVGLILAGGLGRRMGGTDKALMSLAGRPLLAHVMAAMAPQVDHMLLSANGPPDRFAAFGLPVLPDPMPDHPGPLAGLLAGLEAIARAPEGPEWLVSVPADSPFLPHDLVTRLRARQRSTGAVAVCAESGGRTHPVIGLWHRNLGSALRAYLVAGERRVGRFMAEIGAETEVWDAEPRDPFTNINTPEELAEAARRLTA